MKILFFGIVTLVFLTDSAGRNHCPIKSTCDIYKLKHLPHIVVHFSYFHIQKVSLLHPRTQPASSVRGGGLRMIWWSLTVEYLMRKPQLLGISIKSNRNIEH